MNNCLSLNSVNTIYAIDNLGLGEDFYNLSQPNFGLKSLIGDGINLSSDANEITISTNSLETLTNIGSGSQVVESQTATNANIRSITAGTNAIVTQNANDIQISSVDMLQTLTNIGTGAQFVTGGDDIRSIVAGSGTVVTQNLNDVTINIARFDAEPVSIVYNYMNPVNVTYNTYYTYPGTVTATYNILGSNTEGTLSTVSANTFKFTPAPRCTQSVLVLLELNSTNGQYATLVIKLIPNLTRANDTTLDLLLGAGVDGIIYQINNSTGTITPLLNYDGTSVSALLGPNVSAITMNQLDNVLYYTLTTAPTMVRYYDFVTKINGVYSTVSGSSGWDTGAIIAGMSFDQVDSILYLMGDLNASRIRLLNIPPLNRSVGFPVAGAVGYTTVFPSVVGNIQQSIAIDRYSKAIYGVVKPSATDAQLRSTNIVGGVISTIVSLTLTGDTVAYCTVAPSGRVYCIGNITTIMRRTIAGRNTSALTNVFTPPVGLRDLTVSPFGL